MGRQAIPRIIGEMRQCAKCEQWKPFDEFHKGQQKCKQCVSYYNKHVRNSSFNQEYWKINRTKIRKDVKKRIGLLVNQIKYRCMKKGYEFNITVEFVHCLYLLQNGNCLQTGIKLEFNDIGRDMRSISIDRKNSMKGYTFDNVQLVCLFYNIAKNTLTDDEVWQMMEASVDFKRSN